jgi:hypothetical protein
MKTFIAKRNLVATNPVGGGEFIPKGMECVSFGYKLYCSREQYEAKLALDLEGQLWESLANCVGNGRFRLERSSNPDGFIVNLVSIDRWKSGVKRVEVIHSWDLTTYKVGDLKDEMVWSDVLKNIYQLPTFLRKKVTVDLGLSAKDGEFYNHSFEWSTDDEVIEEC